MAHPLCRESRKSELGTKKVASIAKTVQGRPYDIENESGGKLNHREEQTNFETPTLSLGFNISSYCIVTDIALFISALSHCHRHSASAKYQVCI